MKCPKIWQMLELRSFKDKSRKILEDTGERHRERDIGTEGGRGSDGVGEGVVEIINLK